MTFVLILTWITGMVSVRPLKLPYTIAGGGKSGTFASPKSSASYQFTNRKWPSPSGVA